MITSAEEFVRLGSSEDPEEVSQSFWDEAPIEVWKEVMEKHPDKHLWVAKNQTIPDEIMRILATSEDWRARRQTAGKRRLASDLFFVFAEDADESVRSAIACNRKSPLEILEILSADPVEHVAKVAQYNRRERLEKINKSKK